ncbi:BQ2448_4739 [Microbotryum intermedium]|uniref:BQ2448_4739 protein n=1 Tax=Microbotryum intermedium TaxID=269621 RepID=A0A238FFS0_9BASI|nr:BQ2448_4739 [Microbotryum intermedium]
MSQRVQHPDVLATCHASWLPHLESKSKDSDPLTWEPAFYNREDEAEVKRARVAMNGDQTFNMPLQQAGAPYQSNIDAATSLMPNSVEPWNWPQEDSNLTLQALLSQFSTSFEAFGDTISSHPPPNDPTSSSFLASTFTASHHPAPSFASEQSVNRLNHPNHDMATLNLNLVFSSLAPQGFDPHQSSFIPPSGSSAASVADFGLLQHVPPPASWQTAWNNTHLESFLDSVPQFGGLHQPYSLAPPSQLPPATSSSSMSGLEPMLLAPVASTSLPIQPTATASVVKSDAPLLPPSEPAKLSDARATTTTEESSASRRSRRQAVHASTGPDLSHLPPSLRAQVAAANRAREASQSDPSTHPTVSKAAPPNSTGDPPLLSKPWVPNVSSADDFPAFVPKPLSLGESVGGAGERIKSATERLAEGAGLGFPALQTMQDELKEEDFYASLIVVMGRRGVVIDRDEYRINNTKVDLFKLFHNVMLQGPGGERVELDHAWPKVALSMGLPNENPQRQQLATIYSEVLSPYESAWANALLKQLHKLALLRQAPTSSSNPVGATVVAPVAEPSRAELFARSGGDASRFEEIGPMGVTKDSSL